MIGRLTDLTHSAGAGVVLLGAAAVIAAALLFAYLLWLEPLQIYMGSPRENAEGYQYASNLAIKGTASINSRHI